MSQPQNPTPPGTGSQQLSSSVEEDVAKAEGMRKSGVSQALATSQRS